MTNKEPPAPKVCKTVYSQNIPKSVKRIYVKEGNKQEMCPMPGAAKKYGWCTIKEVPVRNGST